MVVLPTPTMVTVPTPPVVVTVATAGALLVYVIAPSLLLLGAVMLNDASPRFLAGTDNGPIVGAIGETTSVAVTLDPPV
jgi:hypothetical protein